MNNDTSYSFKLTIAYTDEFGNARKCTSYWYDFGNMINYASKMRKEFVNEGYTGLSAYYRVISSPKPIYGV